MKTAIQEMIDIVEMDYSNGVEISMKVFHNMLKDALAKEKAIIAEAYDTGYNDGYHDYCEDGENYYTEKFTQK